MDCSWLINIPEGRNNQKLVLDFTHFHLDSSTDCENDYVAIYEGPRLNKLVGKYCGRQAPPAIIFAADEKIRIEFHTDGEAGFEGPTGFAAKFHKAPRKLTDSGCRSSAEQMSAPELEKYMIATRRFTKCNFMIKPKQKKTPQYPVVRFAPQTDPSCCGAVQISNHRKKFDSKNLIDASGLCRSEPVVGINGIFNIQIKNDLRDKKGRKCKIQLGFYSVSDPMVPYLNHDGDTTISSQQGLEHDTMVDKSKYTCFMEEISYPRYLGKSEQVEPDDRLSSCRIEIRPKSEPRSASDGMQSGPVANKKPPSRRPNSQRPSKNRYIHNWVAEWSLKLFYRFSGRKRPGMANDFIQIYDDEEEEEEEDYDEVVESDELIDSEEKYKGLTRNEITVLREEEQEKRRQERYLARVAYRAQLRALRKEANEKERETNRRQRIHERELVRSHEK